MGNCLASHDAVRIALHKSWLGSYLPFVDQNAFLSACKIERQIISGINSILRIHPQHRLFIVVAGEVSVNLSSDTHSSPICVFTHGDVFFIPPGTTVSSSGAVVCGKYRLTYHFAGGGQVLSADFVALENFVSARPHLDALADVLGVSLEKRLLQTPALSGLSSDRLHVLLCIMKVNYVRAGHVIKLHDDSSKLLQQLFSSNASMIPKLLPVMAERSVGIILKGSCVFVPESEDLVQYVQQCTQQKKQPRSNTHSVGMIAMNAAHGAASCRSSPVSSYRRSPKNSYHGRSPSSIRSAATSSYFVEVKESCGFGTTLGLEKCFIEHTSLMTDSLVATDATFLVHVSRDALQVLFRSDTSLKRVVRRNYMHGVLGNLRGRAPLLQDIEPEMLNSLCQRIRLRGYAAGEPIFHKGTKGGCCFIVVHGLIQEAVPRSNAATSRTNMHVPQGPAASAENLHLLAQGSLFGESALVAGSCYTSTAVALEYTVLACISKRTLEEVYSRNKVKLAELCIRLAGADVDLDHILLHPTANALLRDFLTNERSEESLLFHNAVTQYEEQLENVKGFITKALPMHMWETFITYSRQHEQGGAEANGNGAGGGKGGRTDNQAEGDEADETVVAGQGRLGSESEAEHDPQTSERLGAPSVETITDQPRVLARHKSMDSTSLSKQASTISRESSVNSGFSDQEPSEAFSFGTSSAGVLPLLLSLSLSQHHDEETQTPLPFVYGEVLRQVNDVKAFAKAIVDEFIHVGAPREINLSDHIRKLTERHFARLLEQPVSTVAEAAFAFVVSYPTLAAGAGPPPPPPKDRYAFYLQQNTKHLVARAADYYLFKQAKHDIHKLLKHNGFARWKKTPGFQNFLASFKPISIGAGTDHPASPTRSSADSSASAFSNFSRLTAADGDAAAANSNANDDGERPSQRRKKPTSQSSIMGFFSGSTRQSHSAYVVPV